MDQNISKHQGWESENIKRTSSTCKLLNHLNLLANHLHVMRCLSVSSGEDKVLPSNKALEDSMSRGHSKTSSQPSTSMNLSGTRDFARNLNKSQNIAKNIQKQYQRQFGQCCKVFGFTLSRFVRCSRSSCNASCPCRMAVTQSCTGRQATARRWMEDGIHRKAEPIVLQYGMFLKLKRM